MSVCEAGYTDDMSGEGGSVCAAEHDVEVAARGQGAHQRADLEVLLEGHNLEGG